MLLRGEITNIPRQKFCDYATEYGLEYQVEHFNKYKLQIRCILKQLVS